MEDLKNQSQQEGQRLTKQERRDLKKRQKEEDYKQEHRKRVFRKIIKIIVIVLVIGGIVFIFGWLISKSLTLPPTSMQGHIEQSPPSHIVSEPIPENIQKHMLEHADGGGSPGIIIQYNCTDYNCEPNLVQKLTIFAEQYPENVYLAPSSYDGKIILTKLGKREILERFDEQRLQDFIGLSGGIQDLQSEGDPVTSLLEDSIEPNVAVNEISMFSDNFSFAPNKLILAKDQPVKITIQNTGFHTFTIDELGIDVPLRNGAEIVEFTPTQSGVFEYYCAVPGHRELGQVGLLTVE